MEIFKKSQYNWYYNSFIKLSWTIAKTSKCTRDLGIEKKIEEYKENHILSPHPKDSTSTRSVMSIKSFRQKGDMILPMERVKLLIKWKTNFAIKWQDT